MILGIDLSVSFADGVSYQICRFFQSELLHHIGPVGLDRMDADKEEIGNGLVRFPLSDEL